MTQACSNHVNGASSSSCGGVDWLLAMYCCCRRCQLIGWRGTAAHLQRAKITAVLLCHYARMQALRLHAGTISNFSSYYRD